MMNAHHGERAFSPLRSSSMVGLEALARQQQDHAEGHEARQHVSHHVEHRGRIAVHVGRQETHQHVAHVGDRRVREHPLQVGLRDRHDVPERHRQHRQHDQHALPTRPRAAQRAGEHAQDHRERREFGAVPISSVIARRARPGTRRAPTCDRAPRPA